MGSLGANSNTPLQESAESEDVSLIIITNYKERNFFQQLHDFGRPGLCLDENRDG